MSRNQQTAANNSDGMGKSTCYCAAHGCPLLGTVSTSTTGGSDWWCFLHFSKDAVRLQAITVEINRRDWLARAITDLRMHYATEKWADVYKLAKHELAMQQRNDLQIRPETDAKTWEGRAESVGRWIQRLESELQAMCSATFTRPPKQTRLPVDEPLQKVAFEMPGA
jgi:hypothetical protein